MRWLFTLALVFPGWSAVPSIQFNRDVRHILSDKCWTCHGPDAVAKKIPLRLDSEAEARRVIASGELVKRITAEKARRMPPAYSGLALTDGEIEILREWVAQGGQWQKHWSFLPPVRPDVPAGANPIDWFVRERLRREGLSPAPEASRDVLLRRVSLDLTGLPPSAREMDAFQADRSRDAYEKAVDRLLASPRYGERMAARWLDAARYADTNGYQFDGPREMWRWRDWVIDAFNRNQPFDRFALEQIAGDMLPHATLDQKIATGFNRNHRANTEDGIIPEEYAVEYVVDRVETTATVFMGVTLGCARCHNHKYDPFTQKEFYQVFSYFNNVPEMGRAMKYGNSPPMVAAPTREQQASLDELEGRISAVQNAIARREPEIARTQAEWELTLRGQQVRWMPPGAQVPLKPGRALFDGTRVESDAAMGAFDIEDRFTISTWVYTDAEGDGPLVTKMSDSARGKGYGLHLNHGHAHVHVTSNYADDAIRLDTEETLTPGKWHHVLMTYSGSRMAEGVHVYLNGRRAKEKVELDTLYRPFNNAGKAFREPLRVGGGWGKERRFHGQLEDVRIWPRVLDATEIEALAMGESLSDIAAKSGTDGSPQRGESERAQLRWYFLENAAPPEIREAWGKLQSLLLEKAKLERNFPTVMVMAERPTPRDTFVLARGQYNQPGEKVQPGVPAVLPPLPEGAPNNRLGFARWLTNPGNPLLARVTVNRFWQMYFGAGLVKTTEDFGSQGDWPAHPELLDWLATEFVRTGWDVKAMQKLIVTSATYRQSSKTTPELVQKDPENRLLARGARFRLPAEMVRDQALFVAGLLAEKIGGPSVMPYQPAGLWNEINMQNMDYVEGRGADLHRRSLYTFWKRTVAPPMMLNFDSAAREACVVRDSRTNTPLQALDLMNDVQFLEAARFLGQRMLTEGGATPDGRLGYGFRLVTGRAPSAAEAKVLRDSLQYHLDYFADDAKARPFLKQGETAADASLSARDLAAYGSVGSLLLNLDEAVTKQ